MGKRTLLGFDFGASSGRAILGEFDGETLSIRELHRFPNEPVMLGNTLVWDFPRLYREILNAFEKAKKEGVRIDACGIDTWGVDFGLIDKKGRLMSLPVHYRDSRTKGMMEKACEIMPREEIFAHTGLAFNSFNTLYQLLAMRFDRDIALENADKLLFMPDLFAYFLTGEAATEYTIASTSQMTDPGTRDWDRELLDRMGIPFAPLTDIQSAGTLRGRLKKELGFGDIPLIAVGSHDTASAVAAVPASGDSFAYISSGTWSLLGTETKEPMRTPLVLKANYTNEGGVCGTVRLLRNIMGLWIIQECKREWDRQGDTEDYGEIMLLAEKAPSFVSVIDVDDNRFLTPGNMPEKIRDYCRETGQKVPETKGEIARIVYEGLALKYRWGVEQMEEHLLGHRIDVVHVVGGGCKNTMLNRLTAQAIGKSVITEPSEGTAIGNLLVQAMALGDISGLKELRQVSARSFPTREWLPSETERSMWDDAYGRLLRLMEG